MKISKSASMDSPPPPPPPLPSKSSRKTLIAALVIVIIVIAAIVGAYALTLPASNKPSPSPLGSATPSSGSPSTSASHSTTGSPSSSSSPSQTSSPSSSATPSSNPTSSPSGQSYTHFRAGSWANYTMMTYDDTGTVSMETHEKESISEGTYNGQNCWLLITDMDQTNEGQTTSSTTIIYLSKSTLHGVRYEMYMNGELIYGYDLNDTSTTNPGTTGEIDPNTIISYETKTVAAGTFTDCAKASITTTTSAGTNTATIWAHQSVPVYGLVKMETYSGQQLTMTMELTAYGG